MQTKDIPDVLLATKQKIGAALDELLPYPEVPNDQIEALKDHLRETFADAEGRYVVRFVYNLTSVGHGWINIFSEVFKKLMPEWASDWLKYIVGIPAGVGLLLVPGLVAGWLL